MLLPVAVDDDDDEDDALALAQQVISTFDGTMASRRIEIK